MPSQYVLTWNDDCGSVDLTFRDAEPSSPQPLTQEDAAQLIKVIHAANQQVHCFPSQEELRGYLRNGSCMIEVPHGGEDVETIREFVNTLVATASSFGCKIGL